MSAAAPSPAPTPVAPPEQHTPSLERLEHAAECVRREAVALVEHARELSTRESPPLPPDVWRSKLAYTLRSLERRLTLAQCELVRADDPRRAAADQVANELRALQQHDYPWRGLEAPQ